ncbi:MAG TPA: acyl-CoA dehydrogenase family protein [Steroidobacteraceae bacterium]|nr:acyl-CoA dehydrogenase family protein [Steroidobacteraceae bacterium]
MPLYLFDQWRRQSPYYNDTHEALAQTVRRFVEREVTPNIERWEQAGEVPRDLSAKAAEIGILQLGFPEEYGGHSEGVDLFHAVVAASELAYPGASGLLPALMMHGVALVPVLKFGSEAIKRQIAPEVLAGRKLMAICLTEPSGGSDLAAIKTRARRRGDRWVLNGSKTFISSGMRADWYTVVARTGEGGAEGLSIFLVEKGMPGFTQTRLEKMGWHMSDTATLHFEDVELPGEYLLGPEGKGFMLAVQNLNNERAGLAAGCCAFARAAIEEAHDWATQRETFGRPLIKNQVIRHKFAEMMMRVQGCQAFADQMTWSLMNQKVDHANLALCKVQATRMLEYVARECAQIMGGASFVRGCKVERIYRDVRAHAIGGGSEEVMLEFAARHMGFH